MELQGGLHGLAAAERRARGDELLARVGLTEAAATRIPGFPTDSYLDFAIVTCFVQGALFATTTAGSEIATDVETGFLNRLSLTPLQRTALVLGQLAGDADPGVPRPLPGARLRPARPARRVDRPRWPRGTRSPRCSRPGAGSPPACPRAPGWPSRSAPRSSR